MIELLVVMLIVGVLMAAIVPTFRGAKRTGRQAAITADAQALAAAVRQYSSEHANQVPILNGPNSQWPLAKAADGPVDVLGRPASQTAKAAGSTGGYYLRERPLPTLSAQRNWATLTTSAGSCPAPGGSNPKGCIVYVTASSGDRSQFDLRVYVDGQYKCSAGDDIGGVTYRSCSSSA